ncbi:acyltransferase domain-containing protein [Nocardiopsis potens]|uniref:acyltransferase domain-containing protein n=1 Tax=Nocardiopsis potens TaxID=1246458 RepID=UPI000344C1A2|nr:acyltransferase domain-containing protein [Nocardiopsis potens]
MDAGSVVRRFGLDAQAAEWLEEAAGLPVLPGWGAGEVASVGERGARELLAPLGLSGADEAELAGLWAGEWPREAAWLVERMAARVGADLGAALEPEPVWVGWPGLAEVGDDRARCAALFAFAVSVRAFGEYQRGRGVPGEVVAATLLDVGRQAAANRRMFGRVGLETAAWVALLFRSGFYELGRLQFEPNVLREMGAVRWLSEGERREAAGVAELAEGARVLRVHIPPGGPLGAGEVAESLGRARSFFAGWLGVDFPVATCSSWLLDPQLAEYLPEGSNILGFQRLFRLVERGAPGDADVFRFVLGMPEVDPVRAPRGSRLERAAADHVAAGREWRVRTGWLRLR